MTSIFRLVLVLLTVSSLCVVALAQSTPAPEQSLHVGGYGSFRFEANDIPDRQFVPGGSAKGFTFRRFVLTTDSKLSDRLRVYSETEFERLLEIEVEKKAIRESGGVKFAQEVEGNSGGEVSIEQLWLQFDLGGGQAIRAGIVLPPLGRFNINHDDDYWDLPRRTLVDRDAPVVPVKTAWREAGAGLVGSFNVGRQSKVSYQAYVLGGSTLDFNLENVAQTRVPGRSKQVLEAAVRLKSGAVDGTKNARSSSYSRRWRRWRERSPFPAITASTLRISFPSPSRSIRLAWTASGGSESSKSKAKGSTAPSVTRKLSPLRLPMRLRIQVSKPVAPRHLHWKAKSKSG